LENPSLTLIDPKGIERLQSNVGFGTRAPHYYFALLVFLALLAFFPFFVEAQRYIAAVQSTGVPIGIWFNGPADDTGYAAVTRENISRLNDAIAGLTQFPDSYAAELSERLFRNVRAS